VCLRICTSNRGTTLRVFASTAARYWIGVFPFVCREIRDCEDAARTIPDPGLRALALTALRQERGNLEGAAAYAAFTPIQHRFAVARATMAFQATYDYADAVSEQPGNSDASSIDRLHHALLIALTPGVPHPDYYANPRRDDGGYLDYLVDKCREALQLLPSFVVAARQMRHAATRIATYQRLNHQVMEGSQCAFARWAQSETRPGSDLRWWETGAAAGSSLSVFAMISAAAEPILDPRRAAAIECAYFPWIGSLHTLLDSLIDEHEDVMTGQHRLSARYLSQEEVVDRLQVLAARASEHAKALHDGDHHVMILAAMVSFYLASPQAKDPRVRLASERVLTILGGPTSPSMLILRARHMLRRFARANSDEKPVLRSQS
jgi:tetraprenyl-beta-curcumene synthase